MITVATNEVLDALYGRTANLFLWSTPRQLHNTIDTDVLIASGRPH
jgi:hypothetical protein